MLHGWDEAQPCSAPYAQTGSDSSWTQHRCVRLTGREETAEFIVEMNELPQTVKLVCKAGDTGTLL